MRLTSSYVSVRSHSTRPPAFLRRGVAPFSRYQACTALSLFLLILRAMLFRHKKNKRIYHYIIIITYIVMLLAHSRVQIAECVHAHASPLDKVSHARADAGCLGGSAFADRLRTSIHQRSADAEQKHVLLRYNDITCIKNLPTA